MAAPQAWPWLGGDDSHLRESGLSRTTLVRGGFLHASRDVVQLPDGQHATREFIHHPGAVMVVPLLQEADGQSLRLVMERQYRYPLGRALIEFPAGKLEANEDHGACAERELREETGYRASDWAYAGRLNPAIAYSDEVIHIWFARELTSGSRALDDGEFLDVITPTVDDFFDACRAGAITDGKSLAAGLWLRQMLDGHWTLPWCSGAPRAAALDSLDTVTP